MAENEFSLHVDTDWKKQAQEEKRRLAEEQAKKAAASAAAAAPASASTPFADGGPAMTSPRDPRTGAPTGVRGRREMPQASFGTLVSSIATQVLYYLGDVGQTEGPVNLDMAKYQLDTLGVIEDKTKGNLNEDEQKLLDTALYEARSRFVGVASQYINF